MLALRLALLALAAPAATLSTATAVRAALDGVPGVGRAVFAGVVGAIVGAVVLVRTGPRTGHAFRELAHRYLIGSRR